MLNCPYSKDELINTLNKYVEAFTDKELDDIEKRILSEFNTLVINTKAELNMAIAKYNGISVDALVSSPNYNTLKDEYGSVYTLELINVLTKIVGDEKVAYAIIALKHKLVK